MRIKPLLLFLFGWSALSAQYASIELSADNIKRIGDASKTATVFVVINNEKDPADAALVSAVKKYWKIGPYKFMAKAEFVDKKMKNELAFGQLYLYEWFSGFDIVADNAIAMTETLNQINTGYFQLSLAYPFEPLKKSKATSEKKTELVDLRFDLSSTMRSNKERVLDGYFDLMIKYYNNEVNYCQHAEENKDLKKENKDGIVYFGEGLQTVSGCDVLLVKEQVSKAPKNTKDANKKPSPADAVMQFNIPEKQVFTVFPDDIKLALAKNDQKVLLYTNDMLISANNGAVVAAPGYLGGIKPEKSDWGFWLAASVILAASFLLGMSVK